jgi:peptide/nickel transport system ATP-binding protein
VARCDEAVPALGSAGRAHSVRCVRWEEIGAAELSAISVRAEIAGTPTHGLLAVSGLEACYRHGRHEEPAVRDVSFAIGRGQCAALVGQSGSGKSTIGRCVVGLHPPSAGEITFDGRVLAAGARSRPLEHRRRIQIVFQNPYQSLNPRQRVGAAIERPLRILRRLSHQEAEREVGGLLERVRLPARLAQRFPAELSGGERQRVAIARALGAQPDLLICDEITSSLDVSVQAAVLELLQDLRRDLHLSMLFITHNLGVVASIADTVLVMERGSLCETGSVDEVLSAPSNDYTRSLLNAAPSLTEAAVARG